MSSLPHDAFVMLDPAVEMLDVELAEHRLLCHGHFEVGIAVPPGEGLSAFVTALMGKPVNVGALRGVFDNQELIDTMLVSLRRHGFLHLTSQLTPSSDELAQLRHLAAQMRSKALRSPVVVDLGTSISPDDLRATLNTVQTAPDLLLRCARLADHAAILAELASLRIVRSIRMHQTVVQTADPTCDRHVGRSLVRLGASVVVESVAWPVPDRPIAGLAALTRARVPVHVLMAPDLSIVDETVRARAVDWAGSVFLTGLCLQLDADALWPSSDPTPPDFVAVFEAVHALEEKLGDVRIVNLPDDEVLLGNAASCSCPAALSDVANRFRTAYLRWRLPLLKSAEGDNTWSQTPEAEEKVVRVDEDLLPNHPELLRLHPGSIVVDVCGGVGRVARRLSPLVAHDGLVISIEMVRCLSERARRFACERHVTNLQFRIGLAQRIPLPDATIDAAVNEWTGAIWELGLGPAMVSEMARVVRPGGRIAVTHRLVRLPLARLGQPWVQYDDIYAWMRGAFDHPQLTVIADRVWGQTVSSMVGENATAWRKQYVPRVVNPFDVTYAAEEHPGPRADIYLTIVAERR